MTHPNNMTAWTRIACTRGHDRHTTRRVQIDLGGRAHGYRDFAQVPRRYARKFAMEVYDPRVYPVDGGSYCPAHDAVSATIVSHGIWEPQETILTLTVCEGDAPGEVLDFGCQVGWYSLLALSAGRTVTAFDADRENLKLLDQSAQINGWSERLAFQETRINESSHLLHGSPHIRFAKIDVEGAEDQVIRILWPLIENGMVDHMLIEVSPVFDDYYGDLVARIIDVGYDALLLPPKGQPSWSLSNPAEDLQPGRLDRAGIEATVNGWHQENLWFVRHGAAW